VWVQKVGKCLRRKKRGAKKKTVGRRKHVLEEGGPGTKKWAVKKLNTVSSGDKKGYDSEAVEKKKSIG